MALSTNAMILSVILIMLLETANKLILRRVDIESSERAKLRLPNCDCMPIATVYIGV